MNRQNISFNKASASAGWLKKMGCCLALGLASLWPTATHAAAPDLLGKTGWTAVMYGAAKDPQGDSQAGAADTDIVANATHGSLYVGFNDNGTTSPTDDGIYFRLRIDNPTSASPATFGGVAVVGIDADLDGDIDLFLMVDGRSNAQVVRLMDPGTGANISPSTTTTTPLPAGWLPNGGIYSFTTVLYSAVAVSATTDPHWSTPNGDDLGGSGGPDIFVSWRIPMADLATVLAIPSPVDRNGTYGPRGATGIVNYTKDTLAQYVAFTQTQAGPINGDLNGVGASYDKNATFASLGAFTAPMSAANPVSASDAVSLTDPIDANGYINNLEDNAFVISGRSTPTNGWVRVTISDTSIGTSDIVFWVQSINTNGTWSVTSDLSSLAEGTITFTAERVTGNGSNTLEANSSGYTTTAVHDITAPTVTVASLFTAGKPTISGTTTDVPAGSSITVTIDPDGDTGTSNNITYTAVVQADGSWSVNTAVVSPTSGTMPSGGLTAYATVSATGYDAAGNPQTTTAVTKPTVNVTTTNDTTPTITGTWDGNGTDTLSVVVNGVTYTAGDGNLSVSGNTWTLTIPPGNALTTGGSPYNITTTITRGGTPYSNTTTAALSVVTGPSVAITSSASQADTTPVISGTSTINNGFITVRIDPNNDGNYADAIIYSVATGSGGAWSLDTDTAASLSGTYPLAGIVGTMGITATATDGSGNSFSATQTLTVAISTISITSITSTASADTSGTVTNSDFVINQREDDAISVSGTSTSAVGLTVTVTVSDDDTGTTDPSGTATVAGDGTWSVTGLNLSALRSGYLTFSATVNSVTTVNTSYTHDKAVPIIRLNTPTPLDKNVGSTLYGSSDLVAGSTISVQITPAGGSAQNQTATVDASGNWSATFTSFTANPASADIILTPSATATDAAGNKPAATLNLTVAVNNGATYVTPVLNVIQIGTIATDNIITTAEASSVVISGTSSLSSGTVTINVTNSAGTQIVSTTATISGGTWSTSAQNFSATTPNGPLIVFASVTSGSAPVITYTDYAFPTLQLGTVGAGSAPTIVITTVGDANLSASEDDSVTIAGTTTSVPDGTVVSITVSDTDGGTANVTGTATVNSGAWTTSLNLSSLVDGALTVSVSATANSQTATDTATVTHDTTASSLAITSGPNSSDSTPVISGTSGFPVGTVISVYVDIDNDGVSDLRYDVTVQSGGTWSVDTGSVPPTTGTFPSSGIPANAAVTVVGTDGAGNTSTITSTSITAISADNGVSATDFITNDPTLIFFGKAGTNQTVSLTLTNSAGTTIFTTSVSANGSGNWTYDYSGTSLSAGTYTLVATVNTSPVSSTGYQSFTVDLTSPSAATVAISGDSGTSSTDYITTDNTLVYTGTADANGSVLVTLVNSSGTTNFSTTITADGSGNWTIDRSAFALPDGTYTLTIVTTDSAGNTVTVTKTIVIDTAADITLTTNATTSDTTPTITGTTDIETGRTITVDIDYDNNGLFDDGPSYNFTATVSSGGVWSADVTTTLANGTYTIRATGTDSAGNSSTGTKQLTIDTNSPVITITEPIGDGNLNASEDNSVTIQGTATFVSNGSSISLSITDGTTTISDTTTVSANAWSFAPFNLSSLDNGTITVTVTYTDNSGNSFSDTATVLHDKSGTTTIDGIGTDTGILSDFITKDTTLIFTGSSGPGASVVLTLTNSAGAVVFTTTVTADSTGSWTYDFTGTTLTNDTYTLKADTGSVGLQSFTVDTVAPTGTLSATSQSTSDTTPTISGVAILGSGESLTVTVNGVTYTVGDGNLTIDGSGNWTLNIPASDALDPAVSGGFNGVYTVTATITDTAGNTKTASNTITITSGVTATLTAATGGSAISADNFGTGTYVTLTGPIYAEGAGGDVSTGTIILEAPAGFVFDTGGVAPTVLVTGSGTAADNINNTTTGSSVAITSISTTQITFTVTDASTTANTLTWQNIRVRPSAGAPLASGNITKDASSTATMSGVTNGTTNLGTLTEVPGTSSGYRISAASATISVGGTDQLTISRVDQYGNTVTNFSSDVTLTFSGLATSPAGNIPTVTDKNGSAINLGTGTVITFVNGVSTVGGLLTMYSAEGPVTLAATDGTFSTTTTGGSGVSLTATVGTATAYRITAASSTPTAGQTDVLTIKRVDQYGNTVTSLSGDVTLTFSGLATSSAGNVPTVTDKTGSAVNLGTVTTITFTSGVATAGGTLIAYAAETATLAVTDGTLTSGGTGGTGAALTVSGTGTGSAYRITAASATPTAGVSNALTIRRVDQYGNTITTLSGDVNLTFSGLANAPAGNVPTVTDKTGTSINLGTATTITFTSGIATAGGISVAYKAESATLHATDGTFSTSATGGTGAALTVASATASKLAFTTQPGKAEIDTAFAQQPVIKSQDTYGNPSTVGLGTTLTVSLTLTSGSGTLSGTTSLDIGTSSGNGSITFTDLQIDTAGAGKQLTAAGGSLTSAVSSSFEVWTIYMTSGDVIVADRGPYFSTGTILISRGSNPASAVIITSIKDPYEVAREADGNFVVVDYETSRGGGLFRIDRLTFAVTPVSTGGNFVVPFGVKVETKAPNAGQIIVADLDAFSLAGAVFRVDPVTGAQTTLTQGGNFYFLQGLAIAQSGTPNDGDIYVTSVGDGASITSKLIKIDPSTGAQTVITSAGDFNYPVGIAVESDGNIIVVDAKAKKVIRVDPGTGTQTVLSDAANGAQGIPFLLPTHVAIDAAGDLYVSDGKVNAGVNERLLFKVNKTTGNRVLITQDGFFEQPRGLQLIP